MPERDSSHRQRREPAAVQHPVLPSPCNRGGSLSPGWQWLTLRCFSFMGALWTAGETASQAALHRRLRQLQASSTAGVREQTGPRLGASTRWVAFAG